MAKKKEGLFLFPEVEEITADLTDAQMGKLMRAAFAYRFRGERYTGKDTLVKVVFNVLAGQIQRGVEVSRQKQEAAAARWNKEKEAEPAAEAAAVEQTAGEAKQSDATESTADAQRMQTDAPIQSNPIQSNPVQSNPVQSKPTQTNSFQKSSPAGQKEPYGEFGWVCLTKQAYEKLGEELGTAERDRCITYLDTQCQSNGNKHGYWDWELMVRRCSREHWGTGRKGKTQPIYGHFTPGKAEMEAVRQVLRQ